MHVLSSAPPGSAWTFGGSILTFAFPMLLFIGVACALYVLYTKPELIPGHRIDERPVSYTAVPGRPRAAAAGAAKTPDAAAGGQGIPATARDGPADETGDGE